MRQRSNELHRVEYDPLPVVKHLRRGCLTVHTDSNVGGDRLVRYKVTSRAFKGEGTPLGVEATWVVGAPVAEAIRLLEQLQPAEQDWLFTPLTTSHHCRRRRDGKPHTPCWSPATTHTSTPAATSPALACRNVALTTDNLDAWQQRLATVDTELADDTLALYVRERLRTRRQDINRLLDPTNPEQAQP